MREIPVTIEGDPLLKGTLTLPASAGPHPGLLFLAGSGPTDRDENTPALAISAFKLLAQAITPWGFATLRYDKRGVGESGGDYPSAGLWDLVDDAERALVFLKSQPEVAPDRLILLGHSEGCWLAAALNRRRPVEGFILLGGAALNLREVILWQGEAAFKEMKRLPGVRGLVIRLLRVPGRARRDLIRAHEAIERSDEAVMTLRGQKVNAKWMREHFAYDVERDLGRIAAPMLAVSGGRDVQVPPEEADRLAALVQGPATGRIIEDMNHLLRQDRGLTTMLTVQADYGQIVKLPLHPGLVELLKGWLEDWSAGKQ